MYLDIDQLALAISKIVLWLGSAALFLEGMRESNAEPIGDVPADRYFAKSPVFSRR
jgi:hypothetical protein